MSLHLEAKQGEIAETVLMPGDPYRVRYIAENFLTDAFCYNSVRGAFGYTGTYKDNKISIQSSGIGMPSMDLYSYELLNDYRAKKLIRIGTCGSYQPQAKLRDVILAMSTSTDSSMNIYRLNGFFAPCADFKLLSNAYAIAGENGIKAHCGNVISSDAFYGADPDDWKKWADFNVLGVEMEACALYSRAAQFGAQALAMMTVTDCFTDGARMSTEDREKSLNEMIMLGLETAISE